MKIRKSVFALFLLVGACTELELEPDMATVREESLLPDLNFPPLPPPPTEAPPADAPPMAPPGMPAVPGTEEPPWWLDPANPATPVPWYEDDLLPVPPDPVLPAPTPSPMPEFPPDLPPPPFAPAPEFTDYAPPATEFADPAALETDPAYAPPAEAPPEMWTWSGY